MTPPRVHPCLGVVGNHDPRSPHQPDAATVPGHPALSGGPIYLDYNATTPVDPAVLEAVLPWLSAQFGNPSSDHHYGAAPREAVRAARAQLAALIHAPADSIVFTGSGSEANTLALAGILTARGGGHLITQATEHPAVLGTCADLATVSYLPVDATGRVDPDDLAAAITSDTVLVSVMHANNETGTVQPIADLAAVAHAHGVLLHTDAAQSVGKILVAVDELGADLLTIAGHKLYAPKGVGALYIRPGTDIRPLVRGGGQERGLRGGTENVALIAGLGAAAALAHAGLSAESQRLRALRDRLHRRLSEHLGDRLRLNGHPEHRLPSTLNISVDGVDGHALLAATPQLAASTGSACHSGQSTPSPVLTAMGLPADRARQAVRLSVGRYTTTAETDRAADLLAAAARTLTPGAA